MYTKPSYTKLTEDRIDKFEKKNNWEVAIGLNEVDNLKPSKYLMQLMEDSIEGKKTYKELENALYSYYKELDPNDEAITQTEECDLVSVSRLARFTSSIWKVHPFCEGNTITTAVFIIKYLRSLGYNVNNDLFKKHSLYFRNALVLSNYSDVNRNIRPDFKYLESFFEKLLIDTKIELEQMK